MKGRVPFDDQAAPPDNSCCTGCSAATFRLSQNLKVLKVLVVEGERMAAFDDQAAVTPAKDSYSAAALLGNNFLIIKTSNNRLFKAKS